MKTTILAAVLAAGCMLAHGAIIGSTGVTPPPVATAPASAASGVDPAVAARRAADAAALNQAGALIQAHEPQAAIERILDPLIAARDAEVRDSQATIYCANTPTESLVYLIPAAHEKKAAIVVDGTLCNAYFMRGFAEVDLGKMGAAQADYEHALALSPSNPHYLNEVGQFHSRLHDWAGALALFHRAEVVANSATEGRANAELGLALRGIGYVDVELGKLDEAEAMYRRCLEIDANDQKAKAELGYVLNLRAKQIGLGK